MTELPVLLTLHLPLLFPSHALHSRGFVMGLWNTHTSVGNILGTVIPAYFALYGWWVFLCCVPSCYRRDSFLWMLLITSKVLASIVQMQQETLSLLQSLKAQSEQVGSKQHVQWCKICRGSFLWMLFITSELRILSIYIRTYVHSKFNLECIAIDCRTLRPQKPSVTEPSSTAYKMFCTQLMRACVCRLIYVAKMLCSQYNTRLYTCFALCMCWHMCVRKCSEEWRRC